MRLNILLIKSDLTKLNTKKTIVDAVTKYAETSNMIQTATQLITAPISMFVIDSTMSLLTIDIANLIFKKILLAPSVFKHSSSLLYHSVNHRRLDVRYWDMDIQGLS